MGLFDGVRCEYPLPKSPAPPEDPEFQTKSLPDPYLREFVIKADGRLVQEVEDGQEVEVDYHGDIFFYDLNLETNEWWEYKARFTKGRLSSVKLHLYRPPLV